jgi:hypothetical protein
MGMEHVERHELTRVTETASGGNSSTALNVPVRSDRSKHPVFATAGS